MKDLMSLLFDTNAFKICAENKPFWYTSGKIGPYFVNTHFLYGSENDANELLDYINYTETNLIQELMKHMSFDGAQELIDQFLASIEELHHLQNRMMVKYALYDGASMPKLIQSFEDFEETQNNRK